MKTQASPRFASLGVEKGAKRCYSLIRRGSFTHVRLLLAAFCMGGENEWSTHVSTGFFSCLGDTPRVCAATVHSVQLTSNRDVSLDQRTVPPLFLFFFPPLNVIRPNLFVS